MFGMFLLFVFTTIIAFVYQFVVRSWSYFTERNVKYVRGVPLLGSAYKSVIGIEPAAVAYRRCYEQFRKERFIGIYEFGGRPSYLIRNPDLIKQLTNFEHFVQPKLSLRNDNDLFSHTQFGLQYAPLPTILGKKLHLIQNIMAKTSVQFTETLKTNDKTFKMYNSRILFSRFANDIIASTAFGIELNSLRDTTNELFVAARQSNDCNYINTMKCLASSSFPTLVKLINICGAEEKYTKNIEKIVKAAVEARKDDNLIDFLIKARDGQLNDDDADQTDVGFAVAIGSSNDTKSKEELQNLTDDDIVSQFISFYLGEFNLISSIASFMFHELAVNPDIQDRLHTEIENVKKELNDSSLTYEMIPKLKYLDMVVSETLRRWCPTPCVERICEQPLVLDHRDGSKVELHVGDSIFVPIYAIHMDEKHFRNPIKFNPERFNDENKETIQSGTYLPFGFNPRNSIGSRFAVMAIKTLAFNLLSEFYIDKSYKTSDPLRLKALPLVNDAERGFFIELRRRSPDRSPYKSQVFT